jgi:hypothetical protein
LPKQFIDRLYMANKSEPSYWETFELRIIS